MAEREQEEKETSKLPPTIEDILKIFKGETRLAILFCLYFNEKLTLKQLSTILNRGKTTLYHHIRQLEDEMLIIFEEKEDDHRKLKTRFYSLNYELFESIFSLDIYKEERSS